MGKQERQHVERITKTMGLAASQARFLCITARKADCEYKSTELAQQKLDITRQLSEVSTEYSNAMNATKLIWSNEAVESDFGMTYGLVMTPSAANNYNPYMLTTPSGAIVLNNEYAEAARAAGISKAGGIPSQNSRDKFISKLAEKGLITVETANEITKEDFVKLDTTNNLATAVWSDSPVVNTTGGIEWNSSAGLGSYPLDKSSVDAMTLADIVMSETIGQKVIDWGYLALTNETQMTQTEADIKVAEFDKMVNSLGDKKITKDIIKELERAYSYTLVNDPSNETKLNYYKSAIESAKALAIDPKNADYSFTDVSSSLTTWKSEFFSIYSPSSVNSWKNIVNVNDPDDITSKGKNDINNKTVSVIVNDSINYYHDEVASLTIGDILSSNIVLMYDNEELSNPSFSERVTFLFNSIVRSFGYSKFDDLTGKGLNVDQASADALKFAYEMTVNSFLKATCRNEFKNGSRDSNKSMVDNSAYVNAVENNGMGFVDDNEYVGISLSNMLSAFLTYYDNALSGADSMYAVGKSVETSNYVTDDQGYYYIVQNNENAVSDAVSKSADFFDQIYNNICERGWREDAAIDDSEYMEAAIKDGRYSMTSLNMDGYHYQTRYNETGYIVEVSDTDAIARAEAEFASKKAELTYKEDSIDIKTKKLDAEISSLSTEYETVKNLVAKSIEKTFQMFSQ